MKSYEAMAREWNRIVKAAWGPDARATIPMKEYATGVLAALAWAYQDRAARPSTALRMEPVPREPE